MEITTIHNFYNDFYENINNYVKLNNELNKIIFCVNDRITIHEILCKLEKRILFDIGKTDKHYNGLCDLINDTVQNQKIAFDEYLIFYNINIDIIYHLLCLVDSSKYVIYKNHFLTENEITKLLNNMCVNIFEFEYNKIIIKLLNIYFLLPEEIDIN